jgi:hypothetical protein
MKVEFQFPNIPKNPSEKRRKKAWGEEAEDKAWCYYFEEDLD